MDFQFYQNGRQKIAIWERGHGRANFSSKLLVKMKKIDFELGFQTKIGSPLAPLLAPLFQIQKLWTLRFLWKKIDAVACLDRFLAQLVLRLPYLPG